jgi:hypothetical protein
MALYLYSTKLKVGSKYLYLTWCAFEHQVRKSSLTLMQGKKQSNAKKKRKTGTFSQPPGQTLWLAGHVLSPPGPGQIPKWHVCL